MLKKLSNFLSHDLAIDLGTANCLVYTKEKGIIINEPSVVAIYHDNKTDAKVLAVGHEAKKMLGKTPDSIRIVRPMKGGVISDFEVTKAMLGYFLKKSLDGPKFLKPKIIICVPFGITPVEKRAVKESAEQAGAREVYLIEEPMAAAIGAGLPITSPQGSMIVNIGGGTTEVAVISLGGIVISKSVRVAGDICDEAIISYIKKKYSLLIGELTAEMVKIAIGNALPFDEMKTYEVKGRDLVGGSPKTVIVTSEEICMALADPISSIVEAIKICLEKTPPELASDIFDNGIILSGGGSMLANLDLLIIEKTGLPVSMAEDPLTCVVRGSGKVLDSLPLLKKLSSFSEG